MFPIDSSLFNFLYRLATAGAWTEDLVIFLANYLGWILLLGFIVYEVVRFVRGYRNSLPSLLFVLSCSLGAWLLAEVLQFFLTSPRPFVVLEGVRQLVSANGNSFPSGHAAFFFALGYAVAKYHPRLGAVYLFGAGLIGLARVAAGVHWPSDVLAGFILGSLVVGLISFWLKSRYNYRYD
jgi:undecaprenyl-diphosphatase